MKNLNSDYQKRDSIIFGNNNPQYGGGVAYFEKLSVQKLRLLVDENLADPEDYQNESPLIKEFLEFGEKYPNYVTYRGYVVEHERSDYRVSIDGIDISYENNEPTSLINDFTKLFKGADEFIVEKDFKYLYCWYD